MTANFFRSRIFWLCVLVTACALFGGREFWRRRQRERIELAPATRFILERVKIPAIEFKDAALDEVAAQLNAELQRAHVSTPSFEVWRPAELPAWLQPHLQPVKVEPKVSLSLGGVTVDEALRYVVGVSACVRLEREGKILLLPGWSGTVGGPLRTRLFKVPPNFFYTPVLATTLTPQNFLQASGMIFGPGSSASLLPGGRWLRVCNTQEQLDLCYLIVEKPPGSTWDWDEPAVSWLQRKWDKFDDWTAGHAEAEAIPLPHSSLPADPPGVIPGLEIPGLEVPPDPSREGAAASTTPAP